MRFGSPDVFIVGAGPAGLSAAIALRQAGAEVLIADALQPPIDKACGEGLMPDSLRELSQLGLNLSAEQGASFSGIRFADQEASVSATFSSGEGIGIRRLALHQLLLDRASEVGVRMRWGTSVSIKPGQPAEIDSVPCRYQYMVGADGHSSRVRAWAGLNQGQVLSKRYGFRSHFEISPWSAFVEVHWGQYGQAYVTPVGKRQVCVAVISKSHAPATFQRVIDSVPFLRKTLSGAPQLGPVRGAVTTTSRISRIATENVALIGDASGSADAVTGEGLAMGFRQALLLRDSILGGGLQVYAAGHAKILRQPQQMARIILLLDRYPALRRRALRAFASNQELFAGMLQVHIGEEQISRFLVRNAPELGFRLFSPAL